MKALDDLFDGNRRWLVVTGAGCSAASGIPTYRDRNAEWQRSQPIQHQEFVTRPERRQRYWARSFAGWPAVRDAVPNAAHETLAAMERMGIVSHLVTQNVDRLHQKAGHQAVTDLHGRLDLVRCLDCGVTEPRQDYQQRLAQANPTLAPRITSLTPDGDAEVPDSAASNLRVPACLQCDGIIKPEVVFFGGSVPRHTVARVEDERRAADGVLVVGSTLMVFSSFRICRSAVADGQPLVIVNQGQTRADSLATHKIDADCQHVLSRLAAPFTG